MKKLIHNEKIIIVMFTVGIVVFLVLSVVIFLSKGKEEGLKNLNLGSTPSPSPTAKPYPTLAPVKDMTVMINNTLFNPSPVTIARGNTVSFLNISQHPIIIEANDAQSSKLNLGTIESGDQVDIKFTEPGSYTYKNREIPSETGVVVIK